MQKRPQYKRFILILTLSVNLWLLFYYKYAAFFLSLFGVSIEAAALPVGISFYTFQAISYTLDVYRGEVAPQKKLTLFFAYLTLFPQLVAGPIVRYSEVDQALIRREHTAARFAEGAFLFAVGLSKKLVIADSLAPLSAAFHEGNVTALSAWLAAIAFTLQIYFDFSGYSDMARGLGKLFGFDFPENFRYPFLSRTVSEFWRRWHITLSSFFKSYVYIPLGGSRRGRLRTFRNLLTVWALTGLWHGASFSFLIWGLLYGVLLIFEKSFAIRPKWGLGNLYTMLFVVVGFVFFSADSLSAAISQLGAMLSLGVSFADAESLALLRDYGFLLLVAAVLSTPAVKLLYRRLGLSKGARRQVTRLAATPLLLLLSLSFLVGGASHPFLYFRF